MQLPRGITGFRNNEELPLSRTDFATFRRHCFSVASLHRGRVRSVAAPTCNLPANFRWEVLDLEAKSIAVALNSHWPIIAFVELPSEIGERLQFINVPEIVDSFRNFMTYEILDATDAKRPLQDSDCLLLSPAELCQISYWQPKCYGDVVFNFWD